MIGDPRSASPAYTTSTGARPASRSKSGGDPVARLEPPSRAAFPRGCGGRQIQPRRRARRRRRSSRRRDRRRSPSPLDRRSPRRTHTVEAGLRVDDSTTGQHQIVRHQPTSSDRTQPSGLVNLRRRGLIPYQIGATIQPMRLDRPRITPLAPEEWPEEVGRLLRSIRELIGYDMNFFSTLARYPKLYKRFTVFGNHVRMKSSLRSQGPRAAHPAHLLAVRLHLRLHPPPHRRASPGHRGRRDRAHQAGPRRRRVESIDAALLRAADELHADTSSPMRPGPRSPPGTRPNSSWTSCSASASTSWSRWR